MFSDIVSFAKNPDYQKAEGLNFGEKVVYFLKIVGFYFVALFVVSVVVRVLYAISHLGTGNTSDVPIGGIEPERGLWGFLFIVVLLGPIVEEMTFRLPLARFNVSRIRLFLSLIVMMKVINTVFSVWSIRQAIGENYWVSIGIYYLSFVVFTAVMYCTLSLCNARFLWLEKGWNERFPLVFYCMSLLFVVLHTQYTWWMLPTLCVTALFLGYTRIRLGLGCSIVLHILINFLASLKDFMPQLPLSS